jgi:ribulose-5-phosphate 4-epimerase/fuculose-1-phosphate aldolase
MIEDDVTAEETTMTMRADLEDFESAAVLRLREDLALALRAAALHGLAEGVCNHFSIELPDGSGASCSIPRGLLWSEVRGCDIVMVDGRRQALAGRHGVEPTAMFIHGAIHAGGRKACVLHTHMPYATALTLTADRCLDTTLSQNAMRFHGRIAVDAHYNGLALDASEGERIAAAMGGCRRRLSRQPRRRRLRRAHGARLRRPVLPRARLHGAGAGAVDRAPLVPVEASIAERVRDQTLSERLQSELFFEALRAARACAKRAAGSGDCRRRRRDRAARQRSATRVFELRAPRRHEQPAQRLDVVERSAARRRGERCRLRRPGPTRTRSTSAAGPGRACGRSVRRRRSALRKPLWVISKPRVRSSSRMTTCETPARTAVSISGSTSRSTAVLERRAASERAIEAGWLLGRCPRRVARSPRGRRRQSTPSRRARTSIHTIDYRCCDHAAWAAASASREERLLEVRHARRAAGDAELAELIEHAGGRRAIQVLPTGIRSTSSSLSSSRSSIGASSRMNSLTGMRWMLATSAGFATSARAARPRRRPA